MQHISLIGLLHKTIHTLFQIMCKYLPKELVDTREIPAFGGISLALRGSGASGAMLRGTSAPICRRLRRR